MSLEIGRQGYLGIAMEDTPGSPEASVDVFIPFTENTLMDKHEKLVDIASYASRVKDHDSVEGKKWGEGDVAMYVDCNNIGYLFKVALGNETKTTVGGTPEVHDHQFYVTTSGNTPKSATVWNYRGDTLSVKQHSFACIDTFELEITNEDIGVATAAFLTGYPTKVTAPSLTTTSGTLVTWKDMTVKFGTDFEDALTQTAIKLTNFKLTVSNNVEAIYRAGSSSPSTFILGEAEATLEYTLFLEDDTELDAYRNMTRRAMVIDLVGAGLGGGYTERVRIGVRRMFIEDSEPETDLDGVWAINQTARVIQGTTNNPGYLDITVRNLKTTVY